MADNFGAKENCLLLLVLESGLANFLHFKGKEAAFMHFGILKVTAVLRLDLNDSLLR